MIPSTLSLKNFMCYRRTDPPLSFDGIQMACICGDNGHGKSALLDAITWALWGRARTRSADQLVHLGESDMEAELEFTSSSDRYRVIRKHTLGRPGRAGQTVLELHAASDPEGSTYRPITANTVRETQKRIIDLLRMDYDTFVNSAFLRQGRADEFTVRTAKERKQVLSEILGLSLYDDLEANARKKARAQEMETSILERDIEAIDVDLEHKSEYEAQRSQAEIQAEKIDREEASQRGQLQQLGLRRNLLQAKEDELDQLQRRLGQRTADLELTRSDIHRTRSKLQAHSQVLSRRDSIEEGYSQYRESLQRKECLDRKLAASTLLIERRGRLDKQIADHRAEVLARRERLQTQLEQLQDRVNGLPSWEEELVDLALKMSNFNELEAEIRHDRDRAQGLSAQAHHLKTLNAQLRNEMNELKDKVEMLTGGETQCPLCGGTLGEGGIDHIRQSYQQQGEEKRDRYRENEKSAETIGMEQVQLEKELRTREASLNKDRTSAQGRVSVLERDVEQAKSAREGMESTAEELKLVQERVSQGSFAADLQQELSEVQSEIGDLGYSAEAHQEENGRLVALKSFEEQHRNLQDAQERLPELEESVKRLQGREESLTAELEQDSQRQDSISAELQGLPQLLNELDSVSRIHEGLLADQRRWRETLATLREKLRRIEQLESNRKAKESELKQAAHQRGIFEELAHAFGKSGVQALIIETVLPELEDEANRLLGQMTDNRMHVKMETQREKKTGGAQETLDINISDELGTRPYELYSGGEAFRINLALRIALSKLLAHRAGAPLPILFMDEGFGTQDGPGREKLLETINSIQPDFEKIIVITHIDEMKEAFPTRIQVTKGPEGSTFSVN